MVNNNFKNISLIILIIFLINFISAEISFGKLNYSLTTSYGPGDNAKGWINISLKNEPTDSILNGSVSNIEESFNLFELLKKDSNKNFIYTCNPLDCSSDYIATNEESSKIFNLENKETAFVGLKITESKLISDISSFSIKVSSDNNVESSRLPISIDILNDGTIDFQSNSASGNFNPKEYGCYTENLDNKEAGIITTKYCEKIILPPTPKVEIGAEVIGTGNVNFMMSIEKADGSSRETCLAGATGNGEIKCSPEDFFIEGEGNYFVCIETIDSDDNNKYKIKYEEDSTCGFSGDYSNSYEYDFKIFASSGTYAPFENVVLNEESILDDLKDYLFTKYKNDCSKNCVIPIKLSSGISQQITLTEPILNYVSEISTSENSLYNLEEIPAQVSSGFQKLYLDEALFSLPKVYGNYTFSIRLNKEKILSENITIQSVPTIKFLTPMSTAAGYQTNFIVYTNWSSDIAKYFWDFGDDNNITTTENKVSHTYDLEGDYNVKVKVVDRMGRSSSKTFIVNVLSASELVPTMVSQAILGVKEIKGQLNDFSEFERESISYTLRLNETEKKILEFNKSISGTVTEQEYGKMFEELLSMNIPQSVEATIIADGIIFYPQNENIDLTALEEIEGGTYDIQDEGAYEEAIYAWYSENIKTTINYKEISADYGRYKIPLMNTFNIKITNKAQGKNYIIFKKLEDLFYYKDYSQSEWGEYDYIPLSEAQKEISFSTSEEINFETLPLFIAPKISELVVIEGDITPFEENSRKWVIFSAIVAGVILIGIIVWMLIKLWYKRKYETYLFKDRNNLYNIISYIDGEKKKGIGEQEISDKLKKAGWNREQIKYALKKYLGKKII